MEKPIPISEAEAVVMETLWQHSLMSAEDVVKALAEQQHWQEPTVKTLLNRLLNKGAIAAQKDGRRYLYSSVLTREDWLEQESGNMLDRLFGGKLAPLVAHFGKHGKLSRQEIEELKRLIDDMGDAQ